MKIDLKKLAEIEQYMPIIVLKQNIQNAVLDMMGKVLFDEGKHTYTRVSDGKLLAGVTSVTSLVPKEWLAAWGAKESVKFLGFSDFPEDVEIAETMLKKIKACKTIKQYVAILKEAKGAAFRKSKDAMLDGKIGHDWIERYIKTQMRGEKAPDMPEGMLERPLKQFLEWEKKNIKLWLLSEARVCDPEREYAGTLDAMAIMNDGSSAIIDYKFASHISDEYSLQLAGYVATFEKYGIKIDKRIIVRLPKTLEIPEWNPKTYKYKMIENNIEIMNFDKNYEFDRDTFYSALPVRKWVNFAQKKSN